MVLNKNNIIKLGKKLKEKDPVEIIIGINIFFFIISFLLYSFHLFKFSWGALNQDYLNLKYHPWTLVSYAFFHSQFITLVFNLILLYYFGYLCLEFVDKKKWFIIYFVGIILGGLIYLASFKFFPNLYVETGPLLGASSGIMALITYASLSQPKYQLHIRFLGQFKLIHILIFFILFNLLQIPLGNPGGYFAHIGGAIAGLFIFFIDKYIPHQKKKEENLGKNYQLNQILDKINQSGYESLSEEEKDFLFRQGKN